MGSESRSHGLTDKYNFTITFIVTTTTKATIQQVTVKLAASNNVLLPGRNHLLTTGTDDLSL